MYSTIPGSGPLPSHPWDVDLWFAWLDEAIGPPAGYAEANDDALIARGIHVAGVPMAGGAPGTLVPLSAEERMHGWLATSSMDEQLVEVRRVAEAIGHAFHALNLSPTASEELVYAYRDFARDWAAQGYDTFCSRHPNYAEPADRTWATVFRNGQFQPPDPMFTRTWSTHPFIPGPNQWDDPENLAHTTKLPRGFIWEETRVVMPDPRHGVTFQYCANGDRATSGLLEPVVDGIITFLPNFISGNERAVTRVFEGAQRAYNPGWDSVYVNTSPGESAQLYGGVLGVGTSTSDPSCNEYTPSTYGWRLAINPLTGAKTANFTPILVVVPSRQAWWQFLRDLARQLRALDPHKLLVHSMLFIYAKNAAAKAMDPRTSGPNQENYLLIAAQAQASMDAVQAQTEGLVMAIGAGIAALVSAIATPLAGAIVMAIVTIGVAMWHALVPDNVPCAYTLYFIDGTRVENMGFSAPMIYTDGTGSIYDNPTLEPAQCRYDFWGRLAPYEEPVLVDDIVAYQHAYETTGFTPVPPGYVPCTSRTCWIDPHQAALNEILHASGIEVHIDGVPVGGVGSQVGTWWAARPTWQKGALAAGGVVGIGALATVIMDHFDTKRPVKALGHGSKSKSKPKALKASTKPRKR